MLFFILSAQAQTDAVLPPIGGDGGGQYIARCPQGRLLTGFELRTGDDVDAIRPLCVNAYGPGDVGPVEPYPAFFGGNGGGNTRQLVCPPDAPVVTGLFVRTEGVTEVVNNIHLYCGVAANTQTTSEFPSAVFDGARYSGNNAFGADIAVTRKSMQRCPEGLVAVGINGRSGRWLDALGLICGVPRLTPRPQTPVTVSSIGKVKTTVGSIGKVKVTRPAYIYGVGGDGTLKWFRHDDARVGTSDMQGPRNVNVGWGNFKQIFPGGEGVIYAITWQGSLMRFQHAGYDTGLGRDDAAGWLPPQEIANGWGNLTQVFSAGEGVIYTITPDGKLWWFKHTGFANGRATWEGPKNVGRGWESFKHVFSGGDGFIYAITPDGRLWWYHHIAYRTGGGLDEPGAWEGRTVVGRGWEGFKQVFSTGEGIIYAITPDGRLWWYRHKAYRTGGTLETPGAWEGRTVISNDWGNFIQVIAQ